MEKKYCESRCIADCLTLIILVACIIVINSCSSTKQQKIFSLENDTMQKLNYIPVTVADMTGLDGCGFLLIKEDSTRLEAINLPDSVKRNGLKLWLSFQTVKDRMSICMAGQIIKIDGLKLRKQ